MDNKPSLASKLIATTSLTPISSNLEIPSSNLIKKQDLRKNNSEKITNMSENIPYNYTQPEKTAQVESYGGALLPGEATVKFVQENKIIPRREVETLPSQISTSSSSTSLNNEHGETKNSKSTKSTKCNNSNAFFISLF